MTIVVYLGPTMPVSQARPLLPDAVFLPPAAQSDIISAIDEHSPEAILLIDGVFTQALSVWHKEILYALERGVAVYGASSMGALRVSETAAFGARGFGRIYEAYVSGELTDDDEVAVMHADAEWEFRSLSDAMVNIRQTLAHAHGEGVVDTEHHDLLVDLAKRRFFPERTYAALLADAEEHGVSPELLGTLREFLRSSAIDQKRADAVALLEHVREHGIEPPEPVTVTRSHPFAAMYYRDRRVTRGGSSIPLADIGAYAALHVPDFRELNEHALHNGLMDVLGEMLKVEPTEEDLARELERFRTDRRLSTDEELQAWRRDNDLNEPDFAQLIHRLAVRRALRDWYVSRKYLERTTEEVLDELRLRGRYPSVANAAGQQQTMLDAAHPDFTFQGDDTELVDLVREQARASGWRPTAALDVWAFESGFKDVYDLRFELVRARLARQAMADVMASLTGSASLSGSGSVTEDAPTVNDDRA